MTDSVTSDENSNGFTYDPPLKEAFNTTYWCISVEGMLHASLGNMGPEDSFEPEDRRPDHVHRGRALQRTCDQNLVSYDFAKKLDLADPVHLFVCAECLRIKRLMVELDPLREKEPEDDVE